MAVPKSDRFEAVKKEKRNLYLVAAVRAFEKNGFHDTTVKDITDAAGTSVGNFYRYFKSKEQIFEVLIQEFFYLMLNKLKELNKEEIPTIQALKNLFRTYIKMFKERQEIFFIYFEQMTGISKEYREMSANLREQYDAEVEKLISRILKLTNDTQQNPRITTLAWTSMFPATFIWWSRSGFEMSEEQFIDYLVNFLVKATMPSRRKGDKKEKQ